MSNDISFCEIAVQGKDIGGYRLRCDRLAVGPSGALMVAQVVAPGSVVKGFAGVLHNNGTLASISLAEGKLVSEDYPHGKWVGTIARAEDGYARLGAIHLGYGVVHALFVARTPGLLLDCTEEALWRELSGPRFTTPLLRAWMPHVMTKLREAHKLVPCLGHRTAAGLLLATTEDLDAIVKAGIRSGRLRMEGRAA